MPRYFFNIIDGYSSYDDEGTELPDIYSAQAMAIRTSGEVLRDMGAKVWNEAEWRLEVLNEQRQILFVLHFWVEERVSASLASDKKPD